MNTFGELKSKKMQETAQFIETRFYINRSQITIALSKICDTWKSWNFVKITKSLVSTEQPFIICRYITGGVLKTLNFKIGHEMVSAGLHNCYDRERAITSNQTNGNIILKPPISKLWVDAGALISSRLLTFQAELCAHLGNKTFLFFNQMKVLQYQTFIMGTITKKRKIVDFQFKVPRACEIVRILLRTV